ncbi:MAG: carboxypeptidase regulatory-like domain-containing protein [Gemmatimonadaceae bacterium]
MRLALAGALLAVAVPVAAQAPNITITGKVTSEAGAVVEGASVQANELRISTVTNSGGNYSIVIPSPENGARFIVQLIARATGFVPQVQLIRFAVEDDKVRWVAGSARMDFVMKRAANETADHERARVPFSVARGDNQSPVSNVPGQADPFARFLFPPELVMQHQGMLNLQESQREALQNAIQQAQTQMLRMQWALAGEGEKLTKLLAAELLDEKEVLAQVDRILMTEREIKRAQMTLMVRIRNTLNAEQQMRLRSVRD